MSGRLDGKTAIVTGAGQGIGRAAAELFAREGAQVLALDLQADALATLNGCGTHVVDLLDDSALEAFTAGVARVDALFNCAGYVAVGDILATTDADWHLSFALNVRAMWRMTAALLPTMVNAGGGSIVNMASVAGVTIGVQNRFAYCASKGAVAGLTRSIAVDYAGRNIRCNAICPGTVQSPSLDERLAASGDMASARAAFVARQPMGRVGTAGEIAELALYLASDLSAYTTGALHVVDGGWSTI